MRVVVNVLEVADCRVRGPGGMSVRLPALTLGAGRAAGLFAPSGAGKSTLLLAAAGLLRRPGWAVTGRVRVVGEDLLATTEANAREVRRTRMAFLPQDAPSALDPLQPVGRWLRAVTGAADHAIRAALGQLGLGDAALLRRRPHAISGGEAQRVLLAVASLRAPALVVADEPTAGLDAQNQERVHAALRALLARGSAVWLATHDRELLRVLEAAVHVPHDDAFVPAPLPAAGFGEPPAVEPLGDVVLRLDGVGHAFSGRTVLDRVDLTLRAGEVVAILGASGAGKTTLARVAAGRLVPAAGVVERAAGPGGVQLLAQDAFASLTPGRAVGDLLAEARVRGFDAGSGADAVALPAAALARSREGLAGGERRRAALLRALAVGPRVLVLDEPTASLDHAAAQAVVATLLDLRRRNRLAMLLITHDHELARAMATRILSLQGGTLCAT